MVQQLIAPSPSKDRLAAGEERIPMSYEEYLAWWGEGRHGEWVDGEVIVFMPPSRVHQNIALWLAMLLRLYVEELRLGEVMSAPFEMRMEAVGSSREPDIMFVATENLGRLGDRRLTGPADLAVEIVSEHSGNRDRREKLSEYAAAGIREYWVIDPRPLRRTVIVNELTDEGYYVQVPLDANESTVSRVLPDLHLPTAWLWEDPLPKFVVSLETLVAESGAGS